MRRYTDGVHTRGSQHVLTSSFARLQIGAGSDGPGWDDNHSVLTLVATRSYAIDDIEENENLLVKGLSPTTEQIPRAGSIACTDLCESETSPGLNPLLEELSVRNEREVSSE